MARKSANQLKVKRQLNEYIAQKQYASFQERPLLYNVFEGKKQVAADLTMTQVVRQFHPITSFTLFPAS